MEDSIAASYTALLLGCLCQGSQVRTRRTLRRTGALLVHALTCLSVPQVNVTTVRRHLPRGDFSIMTEMLKKFLNFMNLTVSVIHAGQLLFCWVWGWGGGLRLLLGPEASHRLLKS